ncbi:MAG: hypothetical protein E7295_08485 [Lachnospiraceae bacterium]|jgi:pyruvate,water dikinase|nr:hypothetical protein [Lachnospiraceae bacterium]
MSYIYSLGRVPSEIEGKIGGKALSLDRMIKYLKLPIPEGYAISEDAFCAGEISPKAREELEELIERFPSGHTYAVRSSAIGEDGRSASFAGQYETVTDVKKEEIMNALEQVVASAGNGRVTGYGESFSLERLGMAVVIQRFVKPEYAGVVFTSDPISGRDDVMIGNFVAGEGEKLVSGQENATEFTIRTDTLVYEEGNASPMARYGKTLGKYCRSIRSHYGMPMDIEWAVSRGKVYILQARPITTLRRLNMDTYEVNGSLSGRKLLTRTNVGEIFLNSVSPMTFSVLEKINGLLGLPDWLDNVCGQPYMNISIMCSAMVSFGKSKEKAFEALGDLAGNIPEGVQIPLTYFDKKAFLRKIFQLFFPKNKSKLSRKEKHRMVAELPDISRELIRKIKEMDDKEELLGYWNTVLIPTLNDCLASILAECGTSMLALFTTRGKIAKIAGEEMARSLCGGCTGVIDSMKPLLYLEDVARGRMSREEYLKICGHRSASEMELMSPRPYENPAYLDELLEDYEKNGSDIRAMQERERKVYEANLKEFKKKYPSKSKWIDKRMAAFIHANEFREDIRSKGVYIFCVFREYLLKTGSLCGIGENVFMLTFDEVFDVLKGKDEALQYLEKRRATYEGYAANPCFPNLILGRFDPEKWKSDPHARRDFFSDGMEELSNDGKEISEEVIKGFPGAVGKVTGIVRVVEDVSHISELQKGDILVTSATNIGWTLAFPKVLAVITDIGAPLSHAAIVAREFGIPAVVGCGNATTVLKTGDYVTVDGAAGTVTILHS